MKLSIKLSFCLGRMVLWLCVTTGKLNIIFIRFTNTKPFMSFRSVRVWLKRDSGQFWPSICHYMPSGATSVCYTKEVWRVFVGQENGTVSVMSFQIAKKRQVILRLTFYRNSCWLKITIPSLTNGTICHIMPE